MTIIPSAGDYLVKIIDPESMDISYSIAGIIFELIQRLVSCHSP